MSAECVKSSLLSFWYGGLTAAFQPRTPCNNHEPRTWQCSECSWLTYMYRPLRNHQVCLLLSTRVRRRRRYGFGHRNFHILPQFPFAHAAIQAWSACMVCVHGLEAASHRLMGILGKLGRRELRTWCAPTRLCTRRRPSSNMTDHDASADVHDESCRGAERQLRLA